MSAATHNWLLVNHLDCDGNGVLTTIQPADESADGKFLLTNYTDEQSSGKEHAPWFLGLTEDKQVIMYDPVEKLFLHKAKCQRMLFRLTLTKIQIQV